jgi:hypothetical protein
MPIESLAEEKRQRTGNVRLNRHLVRLTRGSRVDAGQWPIDSKSAVCEIVLIFDLFNGFGFPVFEVQPKGRDTEEKRQRTGNVRLNRHLVRLTRGSRVDAGQWPIDCRHSGHIGVSLYTTTLDGRILGIGSIVSF